MKTLVQFLEGNADKYANNPYMWEKHDGKFQPTSYRELREMVHNFGAGLHTIGIRKGDRIALLSEGRTLWVVAEMGMFYNGAIDVPLSNQLNEPEDLTFRLKHSEARMIVVSENQAKKIDPIRKNLPDLEKIILLDPKEKYAKDEIYIGDIMEDGKKFNKENPGEFKKIYDSIQPDDVANICYTSGTTADPKGIMLTHRNYTSNTEQALSVINVPEDWVMFLFLPWDHSFAHTAGLFTMMSCGASMAALELGKTGFETRKNIFKNIQEIKPNLMFSVPTIAKNFRANIESGVKSKGKFTWSLFKAGLKVAYRYNGIGINRGKGFRALLKPLHVLFDKVVFSKVRNALGGNMKFFIGGGALLDTELQRFFHALGVPMYQGYGLTEASPIISTNSPNGQKMGASGLVPDSIEIRICDMDRNDLPQGEKGEIVIRGENVMKGYWRNEEATKESLDDGWLYTGDMGYIDKDNFLYVLGRYKSLLIADDGEKYSPEGIEESFTDQSKYIDQILLHNNQKPYTIALVHPDKEAVKSFVKSKGLHPQSEEGAKAVIELLDSEIREYRSNGKFGNMFPQRWIPTAVGFINEGFTIENKLMNATYKVVRPKVEEHYAGFFDYLYTPKGKLIDNSRNMEAIKAILND